MNYIAERRLEEKERRRAEILDAAEAMAAETGWSDMTMDQVARQARLSRALVYVYFKDKTDLMFGICERGLTVMNRRFDEARSRPKRGSEQLHAIGRAYVAFAREFPVYFEVIARCELLSPNLENATPNEQAVALKGDEVHQALIDTLQKGIDDGSVRADVGQLKVVAVVLWGFMHGVLQLAATKGNLLARDGINMADLVDQALLMAIRSVIT